MPATIFVWRSGAGVDSGRADRQRYPDLISDELDNKVFVRAEVVIAGFAGALPIDYDEFRADLDAVVDQNSEPTVDQDSQRPG